MLICCFSAPLIDAAVTHLARSGRLDTAELLCRDLVRGTREARFHSDSLLAVLCFQHLTDQLSQLAQFRTLHIIVSKLSERQLAPAIEWAEAHSAVIGPTLVFQLHEVAFVELLFDESLSLVDRRNHALRYGRTHFRPFVQSHWKRVGYLFSAALFVDSNANADVDIVDATSPQGLLASPYHALVGERVDAWQRAAVAVSAAFAKVCGIQPTSALLVVTRCAWPVVPALSKLAALKRRGVPADASAVALPLAARERLHTVFACPVTRAQSAANNPPTMLPCRHVLARDSAAQLVGRSGMIKCPYCPTQTTLANCKPLQF